MLSDDALRSRMSVAAAHEAAAYTWGATALGTLSILADETIKRRGPA